MKRFAVFAATACLLGAPPAHAQEFSAETRADLECAAWSAFASEQVEDEEAQFGLQMALTYFVGKASARDPQLDISTAFTSDLIAGMIGNMDVNNERCSSQLQTMGAQLSAIGDALNAAEDEPVTAEE